MSDQHAAPPVASGIGQATGAAVPRPGAPRATGIESALARNRGAATVAFDVERLRFADAISGRVGVSGHVYES